MADGVQCAGAEKHVRLVTDAVCVSGDSRRATLYENEDSREERSATHADQRFTRPKETEWRSQGKGTMCRVRWFLCVVLRACVTGRLRRTVFFVLSGGPP